MSGGCGGPRLFRPKDVLAFAEYFQGGKSGVLSRWQARTSQGEILERVPISIEPFLDIQEGGIGSPFNHDGEALWVEPGQEGLTLRHPVTLPLRVSHHVRVHLRAFFYDDGSSGASHLLSSSSVVGVAAVGLFSRNGDEQFYGYMQGQLCSDFASGSTWKHTSVLRTTGWHTFEMIWEEQFLHILIDNEPIAREASLGHCAEESVSIFSAGDGYGIWSGVELFHTPIGHCTWGRGVQEVKCGSLPPWEWQSTCKGFWQDSGSFVIERVSTGRFCKLVSRWEEMVHAFQASSICTTLGLTAHPAMQSMLGLMHEIIEERPDGLCGLLCPDGCMRLFPPAVLSIPELDLPQAAPSSDAVTLSNTSVAVTSEPEVEPTDLPLASAPEVEEQSLALECWSFAHETDIEQIERVMSHFIGLLKRDGVSLPQNIRLVGPCKEASHQHCFVYRFGTRRLHFATRSRDNGRLVLVVRCGGGFMDFLSFARRHGGLEHLRMQREIEGNASGRVHLHSVLTERRMHIRKG
jgi:hypothetical protein